MKIVINLNMLYGVEILVSLGLERKLHKLKKKRIKR